MVQVSPVNSAGVFNKTGEGESQPRIGINPLSVLRLLSALSCVLLHSSLSVAGHCFLTLGEVTLHFQRKNPINHFQNKSPISYNPGWEFVVASMANRPDLLNIN